MEFLQSEKLLFFLFFLFFFACFTQTQDVLKGKAELCYMFTSTLVFVPECGGGGWGKAGEAVGGWLRRDDSLQLISF